MAEQPETNYAKFLSKLSILHAAAVGVVFIRTREPLRAQDALKEWAVRNTMQFHAWSMLTGWQHYDRRDINRAPTIEENSKEIITALAKIGGLSGASFPAENADGVFSVMWPHFALPKMPPLMQVVLELVPVCFESMRRTLMIVPPSFEVPAELQDAVAIIDFDLPSEAELREALVRMLDILQESKRPNLDEDQRTAIVNVLAGMTESEAENALAQAFVVHREALPDIALPALLATLMEAKVDAVRRSSCLDILPVESMENVGGLDLLKGWIGDRAVAYEPAARAAGVDRPKGILLVGPPGTGKSLVGKAVAYALNVPLIKFDMSRVYGGLVGQSEAAMRMALKTLEALGRVVVMVDEIDKAVSTGPGNDGGVSSRVLGALLTFMQETKAEIFWVCTANRVQNLPSELVRKGRLDEVWSVLAPSDAERREILGIHLRKRKEDADKIADLVKAVAASDGYVGAEIEAAVKEAKITSFRTKAPVTGALIAEQFGKTKPLSQAFAADFAAMEEWASNNARPCSTVSKLTSQPTPVVRTRQRGSRMIQTDATSLDS